MAALASTSAGAARLMQREVSFPVAGAKLYGTLSRPDARRLVPAVLLLAGPAIQSRDYEARIAPVKVQAELAELLASSGVAALRYDRRGLGRSTGDGRQTSLAQYVSDAAQAIEFLRTQPGIDAGRLAVAGHSEGALIAAALCARDRRLQGLLLLAAPAKRGSEVMDDVRRRTLREAGVPEERIGEVDQMQGMVYRAARTGRGWERVPEEARRAASTAWFRDIIDYDPLAILRTVRQPVLILHGSLDQVVDVTQADLSLSALREGGNRRVTLVKVPSVNHLLARARSTGSPREYSELPDKHIARPVREGVRSFVKDVLRWR
jgi:hypothetical protein